MNGITHAIVFAVLSLLSFFSTEQAVAMENCGVSHVDCEYPCIEWYPNHTDCRKTKKVCHEVCDDFDVDRGGVDDANRGVKGSSSDQQEESK